MKNILKGLKLPAAIPENTLPTPPAVPLPSIHSPVDHAALLQHLLANKQPKAVPEALPVGEDQMTPQHKFARLMGALHRHG